MILLFGHFVGTEVFLNVQQANVGRCQVKQFELQLLFLCETTGLPPYSTVYMRARSPILAHFDGCVRERSPPAVLQSSRGKVICASKQRGEGRGGQSISRLMQCVCVCVCVCVSEGLCTLQSAARLQGYGWGPSLHSRPELKKKKKKLFSSTPHSKRIAERLPRRADLSLPVGTYLSPSLFLRPALKGGCFNLRYTN